MMTAVKLLLGGGDYTQHMKKHPVREGDMMSRIEAVKIEEDKQ